MRLYPPLSSHMEFLANKQKIYEKFPKWWDFKQLALFGGAAFLIMSATPILIMLKLEILKEIDAAVPLGFVLGTFFGMLFITSLLDDILVKMVKDGRL